MAFLDTHPRVSTLYSMRTRIAKWGNSLALRLPKSLTEGQGLAEGSAVEIVEHEEGILLRRGRPKYTLGELLRGFRSDNRHEEKETGEARGEEAW